MRTAEDDLFIDDEGVQPEEYQSDGDMGHISEAEEEQEDDEITRIFTQKKRKRTEKCVISAASDSPTATASIAAAVQGPQHSKLGRVLTQASRFQLAGSRLTCKGQQLTQMSCMHAVRLAPACSHAMHVLRQAVHWR